MSDATSQREIELRKIFPDAKEKIVKDYKCALYADLHHPGHLILTTSNMYFYSKKNIPDGMPNPLAVHCTYKEIKSLTKSGLDGIILSTDEEDEIILDSFQFRNETFDTITRLEHTAKGKKYESVSEKSSVAPIDVEIKNSLTKSLDQITLINELGFLCSNFNIFEESQPLYVGAQFTADSHKTRFQTFVTQLSTLLDSSFDTKKEKLNEAFEKFHNSKTTSVAEFLESNFKPDDVVIKCIRECIVPASLGSSKIRESLTSFYPMKEIPLFVQVNIVVHPSTNTAEIVHLRGDQNVHELFQIEWKMVLTFDSQLNEVKSAIFHISDIMFQEDTKEAIRYEIQTLLKDLLAPIDSSKKATVLLPSYVDLSNQQLTEFPSYLLDMPKLQTLYLHMNNIDKLPNEITKLTNLQVLYLNSNKFTEFPEIVCSMPNLRELHLGRNKISKIPSSISKMNLRELSLSYNELTEVNGDDLSKLTGLKKLYLHNNFMETIPPVITTLPKLKILQIHNNQKFTGRMKEFGPADSEEIIKYLKSLKI